MNSRAAADAEPDDGPAELIAARMVRAIRKRRKISQRELAARAEVSRATIDRIETGAVQPRVDTLVTVLTAAGYTLVLVDHLGRPLEVEANEQVYRDRAGRRFPVHLEQGPTPDYMAPVGSGTWWGWHHIAWYGDTRRVPANTFWKRPKPPTAVVNVRSRPGGGQRIWEDAT